MDLTTLTDDELDQVRRDVLTEQERRNKVAAIPSQIAALKGEYLAAGGDPTDLT